MGTTGSTALVIGDIEVARLTCSGLAGRGVEVAHLLSPSELDIRSALGPYVGSVAVLVRGDVTALRYALLIAHLRPGIRLVVTMFDRTLAEQLRRAVPNCEVTSPADIAVPSIVGACLGGQVLAVYRSDTGPRSLVDGFEGPQSVSFQRRVRKLRAALHSVSTQLRPHDDSSRIMMTGMVGLIGILALDWLLGVTVLHHDVIGSAYAASRVVATVGPGPDEATAPQWYLLVSSLLMLAAIALTALFTAGVVHRLLSNRSVAILGRRTLPRRDHVVVVGLGQVGLRLATKLASLGERVVVVEREPNPVNQRIAKAAGIAVLIGDAGERCTLDRLSLHRARALAAMGSNDLDNVEVAIAARAVAPRLPIVVRAGEGDVIAETQSLFAIGQVRDVSSITAAAVTLALIDQTPDVVYARDHHLFAYSDRAEVAAEVGARCTC